MGTVKLTKITTPSGEVTVDGNMSITGSLIVTGTLHARTTDFIVSANSTVLGDHASDTITISGSTVSIPNNLNFDSNTLVLDSSNNRVGIGTATPSNVLEIEGSSGDLILEIDNNASNSANFQIQNGAGNARVDLVMNDGTANTTITMKDQKVGIGDTTPSYSLDVTGNGQFTTDLIVGDDLSLASDAAVLSFGANSEVTLTHEHDTGLILAHTGSGDPVLTIKNTEGGVLGGKLLFLKDSASPATGDICGTIEFKGEDAAGNDQVWAQILGYSQDATSGSEDGLLQFMIAENDGTVTSALKMSGAGSDGNITVDIDTHDGSAGGLKLGGTLVTSTAAELNILDGKSFVDEDGMDSDSATAIASQQSIKAYVDAQVTASDLDFQGDSGGALSIDLDSETLDIAGGTGITTVGSGNTLTVNVDASQAGITALAGLTSAGTSGADLTLSYDAIIVTDTNAGEPQLILKTLATTKESSSELRFVKDQGGGDTEDGEFLGQITFYGDDEGANQTQFAGIIGSISESDETDEAGTLELQVAESDGTNTAMTTGLKLEGEHATDGQIDVTIGAGVGSTTTIVGDAHLNHDAATIKFGVDSDVQIAHLHNSGLQVACNSANAPQLVLKGTSNDANGPILTFTKDKGAAGADSDDIGTIQFIGDDAAQTQTTFAKIVAEVSEADDTDEAGKLSLFVAESDGTTTALTAGLVLEGEHATDGQIDVTVAAGVASTTTVAGDLTVTGGDVTLGATAVAGTVSAVAAAADTAGNAVTIQGGSALAGDSANTGVGGNVLIQGGAGKGTAAGGSIIFKSATAAGGSSTALNSIDDTILTLASDLSSTFAGAVDISGALTVDAGSSEIDLTTTGTLDVNANVLDMDLTDSSTITITSSESAEDLTIEQVGANDSSIIIQAAGTGTDAIKLNASAGSIDIDASAAHDITINGGQILATAAHNVADAIKLHADAGGNQTIVLANDEGTSESAIHLTSSLGGVAIAANAGKDITFDAGQVVATATHNVAAAIKLHADVGAAQTIQIINDAGTVDGTHGAGAIDVEATAGGISMLWNDAKDLWAEGGRAVITANENAADCIKLHADAGASQTITVVNDAGTGPTAVGLTSTLGGITLNAAAVSTIQDLVTVAPFSTVSYGTDGMYGGNVIKYSPGADDTLTVGGLYYLNTDGTWDGTDADAVSTGGSQLLGIGLGNARSNGVFTRGLIRIPSTEILNLPGSGACDGLPVYVAAAETAHLDFTPPNGSGDFVRIVGYAIDDNGSDVLINFDPDSTMVLIS